jgi:hypothetical protein
MRLDLFFCGLITIGFSSVAEPAEQPFLITSTSLGRVTLCQPVSVVQKIFPSSRDTRISSEGTEWAAKMVDLDAGGKLLFESSSGDPLRITRISTSSPRYVTQRGYRVGNSIADLLKNRESLEFSYPEGHLSIRIVSENIWFEVDDDSATKFWAQFSYSGDPLKVLDRDARIKQLTIVGSCGK